MLAGAPLETTSATVLPPDADAPPAGFWLITEPLGTLALPCVDDVTRNPADVSAAVAAACVCPTVLGTVTPVEMVKATAVPANAGEPAAGICETTDPTATVACGTLVIVPATRPAAPSAVPAAPWVSPT